MHYVAIFRVAPENVWDNLAESLREDTLVDVFDGVVDVFLGGTDSTHHITV